MSRVLKPDGILIPSAPMTWPPRNRTTLPLYTPLACGTCRVDFEILDEVRRGNNLTTLAQMFLDTQLANIGQALPQRVYSTLLFGRQPGVQRWQPVQASSALPWMGDGCKMSAEITLTDIKQFN